VKTATEEDVQGTAMITTDMIVEFQIHLSHSKTQATTGSIADMDHVVNRL